MAEYCRKCGALLTVGLVYCVNCGEPVANVYEEPETVVRHEFTIPQPSEDRVKVIPEPEERRSSMPVIIAVIAASCAVMAVATLFYVLGRQSALRDAASNQPTVSNQTPQPILSPTPVPSPTPAAVVEKDDNGPTECTANEKAQLHENCDRKDCDTDPTTVVFGISAGSSLTKLGFSKQSRKYRWEKVSVAGREAWIASTKLDCTPPTATRDLPTTQPPANTSNRSANRATPMQDLWRGVPTDVRAICNDGTYSYSGTRIFQCMFHKGVRVRR